MKEPSVLDMKIGRRLYDEDASPEKAARMIRKSAGSTSGKIGFRISGMRVLYTPFGNFHINRHYASVLRSRNWKHSYQVKERCSRHENG